MDTILNTSSRVVETLKMEELLVDIWCKLLELEKISIYDSFFELGGNSLLVVQMISQIKDRLDIGPCKYFCVTA